MLLEQKVKVRWNPKNKDHYTELGYSYTKYNEWFEVDIKDLMKGAKARVDIECDYCGEIYDVIYNTYNNYNKKDINKDACDNCKTIKLAEITKLKFGVKCSLQLPEVQQKRKETNLKKYGYTSATKDQKVKDKISKANRHFDLIPLENIPKNKKGNLELTGLKFGKLIIIKRKLGYKNKPLKVWICECTCENKTIFDAEERKLLKGEIISCGCIAPKSSVRMKNNMTTHGESKNRIHRIWTGMIRRCHNEKDAAYLKYGDAGIFVCDEWRNDYFTFKKWALNNGYEENLTIDRIDNYKGYEPGNCRWITKSKQGDNKRNSRYYEINGENKTLTEWANYSGLPRKLLESRVNEGWTGIDLLKPKEESKSGHKYILWRKGKNRWIVSIYINEKERITIGSYKNLDDAIEARNEALQDPEIRHRLENGNKNYINKNK